MPVLFSVLLYVISLTGFGVADTGLPVVPSPPFVGEEWLVPAGMKEKGGSTTASDNAVDHGPRASVDWRTRRSLTWEDFKAEPLESAPNAALTSTSILINYKYGSSGFHYTLQCVFYPDKSWTKVSSSRILAHEQGHFDISQLYTRYMHKALAAYEPRDGKVEADVMAIYKSVAQQQADFQKQYDTETNYSRDYERQEVWQERIAKALKETEKWGEYP